MARVSNASENGGDCRSSESERNQPTNTAFIGLIKRLGFRLEGLSERNLKINGEWQDHERWALTREEVPANSTRVQG